MFQIGWFSTGRDEAAIQLFEYVQKAIKRGELLSGISYVFSNREPGENEQSDRFFTIVKQCDIPVSCLSYQKFKGIYSTEGESPGTSSLPEWRSQYDSRVRDLLKGHHADLVVLAGYMLIVSPELCQHFNMINLHPALPGGPTGTWQEVIWKLIENKAVESGVMMHRVTPELDRGPVVTFCRYKIKGNVFQQYWKEIDGKKLAEVRKSEREGNALFQKIREAGLMREFPLILYTIKAFSEGLIRFSDGNVVNQKGEPVQGYDLTEEIDKDIAQVS